VTLVKKALSSPKTEKGSIHTPAKSGTCPVVSSVFLPLIETVYCFNASVDVTDASWQFSLGCIGGGDRRAPERSDQRPTCLHPNRPFGEPATHSHSGRYLGSLGKRNDLMTQNIAKIHSPGRMAGAFVAK
jgi:hypothetical protein